MTTNNPDLLATIQDGNRYAIGAADWDTVLREATASVEQQLAIEDEGWITLGTGGTRDVMTDAQRIAAVKQSRIYAIKDPLATQAIRLWRDYTFGSGMIWTTKDETAKKVLEAYWEAPANKAILSKRGQRKTADMLNTDGEIFFAIFLGPKGAPPTIRTIDPLEITEILTAEGDVEDVRLYKRTWSTTSGQPHIDYYPSITNTDDKPVKDNQGAEKQKTQDAIIYHVTINTIGQRGNPLLVSALDWIKLYRRFLASRAAIMLALARFAWKNKVQGGAAAVASQKAVLDGKNVPAGSTYLENEGANLDPIKTDSGAKNAEEDARLIRLEIVAASGFPEQYFGDIRTGNLATAKTVELPVQKMIASNQALWGGVYDDIDAIVLAHAGVKSTLPINRDFPPITVEDAIAITNAIEKMTGIFPQLLDSTDVIQQAITVMGIKDANDVLEEIGDSSQESIANMPTKMLRAVRDLREAVKVYVEREAKNDNQAAV